jgi:c-di-GMP-binding flagellar brake protein YcgR
MTVLIEKKVMNKICQGTKYLEMNPMQELNIGRFTFVFQRPHKKKRKKSNFGVSRSVHKVQFEEGAT